jgi:hypothetical protein
MLYRLLQFGADCSWVVAVPTESPDSPNLRIQIRVGVAHGHHYGGVSQELFHRNDVHAPFQETRCKSVAQRVPRHPSDTAAFDVHFRWRTDGVPNWTLLFAQTSITAYV